MKTHKIELTPTAKIRPGDFLSKDNKEYGYMVVNPGSGPDGSTVKKWAPGRTIYRIVPDYLLVRHVSSGDAFKPDRADKLYCKSGMRWRDCIMPEMDLWLPCYGMDNPYAVTQALDTLGSLTYPEDYVGGIVQDPVEKAWVAWDDRYHNLSKKEMFQAGWKAREEAGV